MQIKIWTMLRTEYQISLRDLPSPACRRLYPGTSSCLISVPPDRKPVGECYIHRSYIGMGCCWQPRHPFKMEQHSSDKPACCLKKNCNWWCLVCKKVSPDRCILYTQPVVLAINEESCTGSCGLWTEFRALTAH